MAFFTSEYKGKLDAKGRLVLPAKMKGNLPEATSNELFMREGFEPCLELYPLIEYKKIYSKIAGLNEFNAEFRKLQRNFFRGSTTVELDTAGRLLIPKSMLQYANLDKEIVVVGMGNKSLLFAFSQQWCISCIWELTRALCMILCGFLPGQKLVIVTQVFSPTFRLTN